MVLDVEVVCPALSSPFHPPGYCRGIEVVDVHHHFLPERVLDRLRRLAGGAPRLVNEVISITLSPLLADLEAHLSAMDAAGIDTAVLTYSGVSVLGAELCRELNSELAAVESALPKRFRAAAHVDLDDPAAPYELRRCVGELGFRAVALPCSTPRTALDHPCLDPLWTAVGELDLPVILHPALLPSGATPEHGLERSCARPYDTTVAAVRLLRGVLPRFPTLRFVLPHCGGTSVFLQGRIRMFFGRPGDPPPALPRTLTEQRDDGLDEVFSRLWCQLWFDTAGTGGWAPAVQFAASVVGPDRLMFGSDYPLESHSAATLRELVDMVAALPLPTADCELITSRTARLLLGLGSPTSP